MNLARIILTGCGLHAWRDTYFRLDGGKPVENDWPRDDGRQVRKQVRETRRHQAPVKQRSHTFRR